MKISINYDSSMILINPDERYDDSDYEVAFSDLRKGKNIEKFLSELLNRIDDVKNVVLENVDEGHSITIEEW